MTEIDLQGCEFCGKEAPFETMYHHGDCWVCHECDAEFRSTFEACSHEWDEGASYDEHGGEGRYCNKCCGFVRVEDFQDLFGVPAPDVKQPENTGEESGR